MDRSENASGLRTLRGRPAAIIYDEERLLVKYYDAAHETVDDSCIIAVTERIPLTGSREYGDNTRSILIVKADEASESGARFEAIEATSLPESFEEAHFCRLVPPHLRSQRPTFPDSSNFHVIISTRSGTGRAGAFFGDVIVPFLAGLGLGNAYQAHMTTSEQIISELAQALFLPQAKSGVPQTIVLLAGDGAVADMVNIFNSYHLNNEEKAAFVKPTIALIPMGTGNAMANSAGMKNNGTYGLRHLLRGSPQEIPTFQASFSPGSELLIDEARKAEPLPRDEDSEVGLLYGAVVCSWGLHASLVGDSDTTKYRKHGSDRFSMAAKELLSPADGSAPHVYKGKVTPIVNSSEASKPESGNSLPGREHMYILATMVSNLEEKLKISPESRPLDGQMRLLHFGPMTAERVMSIMDRAFNGGAHVEDKAITYQQIDGIRIDFDEEDGHWRRVCVDGKIVRASEGGWVEVNRCEHSLLNLLIMK